MDLISDFATDRGLVLDDFQIQACKAIQDGLSVLVAAPTGSGKTLIADFAIFLQQQSKKRVIYTTPIKALSNQKFSEFCELYNDKNVGLATGDRSIRPHARITIMTTEVLRNIIYSDPRALDDVSHVILDEVHYISDRSRGAVWEEVIIQLPLEIDLVCLSATVSNAEEVAQWLTTVRGSTKAIIHETRSVPLSYWFSFRRKRQGLHVMPLLASSGSDDLHIHPDLYRTLRQKHRGQRKENILPPLRLDLIDYCQSNSMLPAIFFIFSRAGCDEAIEQCFNTNITLTTSDERRAIREIYERRLDPLGNSEFNALNYDIVTHAMERGFAPHHAGLIPPLREAVEEAFVRGLLKVVFATETLAVGVNMPAKTVVIEKLTKFNGDSHQMLTPGEFTQLTGRAGRRGIDTKGHAIVQWNRFVDFEQAAGLASTRSYALHSSFRPTYNMATNLIRNYAPDHARHILNLSLAQFQADDAVVSLERNLETKQNRIKEIRNKFSQTDKQFASMVIKRSRQLDKDQHRFESTSTQLGFFAQLHAGDVLEGFTSMPRCVVVFKGNARRNAYVRVLDLDGRIHTLNTEYFNEAIRVVGHIDLPVPVKVRTKIFRFRTTQLLRDFKIAPKGKISENEDSYVQRASKNEYQRELLDEYISFGKDVKRLTRRVQSRGQSLARQFERILLVLGEYGYVDEWNLSEKGKILSQINTEADLALSEQIFKRGLLNLNEAELVGFLSTLIFESREQETIKTFRFPTQKLENICIECDEFIVGLNRNEREAGILETRGLDFAMMYPCYKWAKGKNLRQILENHNIAGGDFVRTMKSVLDLIRQIEKASDDLALVELCTKAHLACMRDVIEISS